MKSPTNKPLVKAQNGLSIYGDPAALNPIDNSLDVLKSAGSAYLGNKISSQAYFDAIMPNDPAEAKRRSNISAGISGAIGGASSILSMYNQRQDYQDNIRQIKNRQADQYYRLPVDRYAYNSFLTNPYGQTSYQDGGEVGMYMEEDTQDTQGMPEAPASPKQQVTFDSTFEESDQYYPEDDIPMNESGVDMASFRPTLGNVPTRFVMESGDIESTIARIGQHESGGDYEVVNTSGGKAAINATGKYQFVPKYWHKEIAQYQGTEGKSMEETMSYFKNNPSIQEGFMRHVVNKYYLPEVKTLLPLAKQYGIDQEGLIKMLHYRGIEDTRNRLRTGNFEVSQKEKTLYNNPDILSYIRGRK